MKIEKISENKLKIIMPIDELSKYNIRISDIKAGSKKAQRFFFDIIEHSKYNDEFLNSEFQLLVQSSINMCKQFIVTITKICDSSFPKPSNLDTDNITYTVSSFIYFFEDIDSLLKFAHQTHAQNLFTGKNSLYKIDNKYFIMFSRNTVKDSKFIKTFSVLSEFCSYYISKKDTLYVSNFKEHANEIFNNNALQKLAAIF